MKSKYGLLKVLLVLLVLVAAGVIYSCASSGAVDDTVSIEGSPDDITAAVETVREIAADDEDAQSTDAELICVHVCGAVLNPGVYYLEPGSRVHQAVELAGGLAGDAADSFINLADPVRDGEQIYIPTREEAENLTASAAADEETPDVLVNINTAGIAELTTLTGIGESKAEAIIAYRENVSAFNEISDIMNVSGIGESVYEKIKDSIKV